MALRQSAVLVGVVLAVALSAAANRSFATPQPAPEGGPIEAFRAHNENSAQRVDHRLWASILEAAINPNQPKHDMRIDYGKLGPGAHQALLSYLDTLQKVPVSALNRNEQLAYWLNFYNAAGLSFVTGEFARLIQKKRFQNRSTSAKGSTGKIRLRVKSFYLGDKNPWAEKRFTVDGERLSLNDIEHRILVPLWNDPTVTIGLSCPARGCPPLPDRPYTAETVAAQLAAKRHIPSPRRPRRAIRARHFQTDRSAVNKAGRLVLCGTDLGRRAVFDLKLGFLAAHPTI